MRQLRPLPGAMILSFAFAGAAQAQASADPLAILEAASRTYQDMEAFCATFDQELRVPLLNQVTRSRGELCQRRPNRFLMRFSEPEGDVVVADGEHLWVYFPSTDPGMVFQSRPGSDAGRMDFHREFLVDPGSKYVPGYDGREAVGGRDADVVSLVPRVTSDYRRARLWIDRRDHLVRRIQIEEANESVRTLLLTDVRLNPPLPDGTFTFVPPEGVQVIQR